MREGATSAQFIIFFFGELSPYAAAAAAASPLATLVPRALLCRAAAM